MYRNDSKYKHEGGSDRGSEFLEFGGMQNAQNALE